eukprot:6190717-Pleurochrysis_carterae.AAC.1
MPVLAAIVAKMRSEVDLIVSRYRASTLPILHLSDLDGHARVEVEQAPPAGEIFHVSDALEVVEEALHRSDPDSGEIAEIVARIVIAASEEEDADGGAGHPAPLHACDGGVAKKEPSLTGSDA